MFTIQAPKFLTLLVGLLVAGGMIAAKVPVEPKQYDYVAIILTGDDLRISKGADQFDVVNANPTGKYRNYSYNLTPLLAKINEFEIQGYELIESSAFAESPGTPRTFALLRRLR